ncbi:MAG: twin-arginine translocase TatA/TatE family subunit [Acidobacteriaceae bacterium]|nr:twin-arginine translocase TatA/TatE family subunit [Acidobacteriaceae bacterium]
MGPIGAQEMIALFVIALLLFGPKKLPELGRTLAKALSEFRRAKNELKTTFETHMRELERETKVDLPSLNESSYSSSESSYKYPYEDYDQYDSSSYAGTSYQSATPEPASAAPAETKPEEKQAEATSEPVSSPVQDTVPRTNGTQSTAYAAQEEHRA